MTAFQAERRHGGMILIVRFATPANPPAPVSFRKGLRPAGETLREELKDHRQHPNDLTFDIKPIGCGQPTALAARFRPA
jgi:hypothetical protein